MLTITDFKLLDTLWIYSIVFRRNRHLRVLDSVCEVQKVGYRRIESILILGSLREQGRTRCRWCRRENG